MTCFFSYGRDAMDYLRGRDRQLGEVIDRLGHLSRPADPCLFESVVRHIIGQQISIRAEKTVWERLRGSIRPFDAAHLAAASLAEIQSCGTTFRKAGCILDFAKQVDSGSFDLGAVAAMTDQEAVAALSSLKGIGVWTAEMILLFSLQRQDIFSFSDLAVLRGLRMVYRHRKISRGQFEKYRRRYSPYGSVASLYLWAVACGAIPGLTDPATRRPPAAAKMGGIPPEAFSP
ncbi:DNA-3-methyladenine glycosylase 2 family protein [Mesosutterella sp. AGMB02718]|uniref:DNA-3-methyladenine glycosylase II n=1 Tax=Mesosutterella faecium TaxID=2925194 RepID=A0ABT7ISM0_9BURK|nr:DNA-3-methyladenine glycosylase 2 family protein [Mesosutterella sp. AGMB02718]MDL2060291.1 DNA-3-methyladenine glycosylase 2 family protein [Mesosutterella sp. AGMB02718]